MEETFREMIKSYCSMFLNSEAGQKKLLLAMADVLNKKNIEVSNDWLDDIIVYKPHLRDIKYISQQIKETIDKHRDMPTESCMIICNSIMQISEILGTQKNFFVPNENVEKRINEIYEVLALLGIKRRILSKEDFLELINSKKKSQKTYDYSYVPPERSDESKLVKYGYSVSQNSRLNNAQRQDLLRRIIASKEVSKGYIVSYLKHMIAINGKKESNFVALQKWKSDLDYVLKL